MQDGTQRAPRLRQQHLTKHEAARGRLTSYSLWFSASLAWRMTGPPPGSPLPSALGACFTSAGWGGLNRLAAGFCGRGRVQGLMRRGLQMGFMPLSLSVCIAADNFSHTSGSFHAEHLI